MAVAIALVSLSLLAGAAMGNIVPPAGCAPDTCAKLPTRYPNPNMNYTDPATWRQETMKNVAFYRGVWNKLAKEGPPEMNSFDTWSQTRGHSLFVNLEKHPLESKFIFYRMSSNIKQCCNGCAATKGCVLYLFTPAQTVKDFNLMAPGAGVCYFLTGGTEKKDGPFDKATGFNYGTPAAGTARQQAASSAPMGYLGGFCNPGNSTTNVVDDPHFTGAHGTHFDFNGQLDKAYCLVTDKALNINAVLKGYKTENAFGASVGADGKATRSWIRELGLVWSGAAGKHALRLVARSGKAQERGAGFLAGVELDGQRVDIPATAGSSFQDGDMQLSLLGVAKKGWYEVEKWGLKIGQQLDLAFDMRVAHPKLQSPTDAEVHFNLMLNDVKLTPSVHGVLGQTYRNSPQQVLKAIKYSELGRILGAPVQADGATGKGFLEGAVADYVASGVTQTDCKFSAFL